MNLPKTVVNSPRAQLASAAKELKKLSDTALRRRHGSGPLVPALWMNGKELNRRMDLRAIIRHVAAAPETTGAAA